MFPGFPKNAMLLSSTEGKWGVVVLEYGYLVLGYIQETTTAPVPLWLREAQTGSDIYQKLVAGTAIIVGGIFAYYKLFKERPYVSRLESTITGTAVRREGTIYLQIAASAKNIGQGRVSINPKITALRVRTRKAGSGDWELYPPQLGAFTQRPGLEPGESVGEVAWVELPEDNYVALGLDLYVAESAERGWLSRGVVNLVSTEHNQEDVQPDSLTWPTEQRTDLLTEMKEGVRRWWESRA